MLSCNNDIPKIKVPNGNTFKGFTFLFVKYGSQLRCWYLLKVSTLVQEIMRRRGCLLQQDPKWMAWNHDDHDDEEELGKLCMRFDTQTDRHTEMTSTLRVNFVQRKHKPSFQPVSSQFSLLYKGRQVCGMSSCLDVRTSSHQTPLHVYTFQYYANAKFWGESVTRSIFYEVLIFYVLTGVR